MILLLVILGALLYVPALRHGLAAFVLGWLFVAAMAISFGAPGVLIAWAIGLALIVKAFYRPGPWR